MKILFGEPALPETGTVVVGVLRDRQLTASARKLDERTDGAVSRAMKGTRFKGFKTHGLGILAPAGTGLERIFLLGLGKGADVDAARMQAAGGRVYEALGSSGAELVTVCADAIEKCKLAPAEMAAELAFGAKLRSYRFDKYRTKEEEDEKPTLKTLRVLCRDVARARRRFAVLEKVADASFFTRDLVSEPANVIYPETLAAKAKTLAKLGVKVEVLGEAEMRRLGMGALLAVGQGSERESQLVVMRWNGVPKRAAGKGAKGARGPVAFVGKGVTFDSGGISIKPAGGMEDMKWDMGGAGVVIGLMMALAARGAKVDAVGVVGLVENMPSGAAQRPGDIVTSMSGQTIEVINTDAEGRLVLADALWYCKERFKPKAMIDLATLTGAIVVSLGHERAGLFSNDDQLAQRIAAAGDRVGEPVWRMPLGEAYDKLLKSEAADMKNVGDRGAGSITAAQFLKRFVGNTPWAHLDIAGVTWSKKDKPTVPKGATAFGLRLLDRLVADHYEAK
jgi:leucyl aminopeptidase